MQARQIYVFSHAALIDPQRARRAQWAQAAQHGFDFMSQYFWQGASRGWAGMVTPEGVLLDASADLYDQAFVLFACAWYYRALGESRALAAASKTLNFTDHHLADAEFGGYLQGLSETGAVLQEPPRLQNPHMHMLEALLALYQAAGDTDYLARGAHLFDLFRTRFFDSSTNTLGEYFTRDWRPLPGPQGQIVEPGHHFEWSWILHHYARLSGDARANEFVQRAAGFALTHGVDAASNLAYDEIARSGAKLRPSHRLWPQTETLKALIASAEQGHENPGRIMAARRIPNMIDAIFENYFIAGTGIWQDQLDPARAPISQFVPATSLYHLFLAFSEALRFYRENSSI